jgi:hypothetical protein
MYPPPDHLPGDIWWHWAVTHVFQLFSPQLDLESSGYLFLIKLIPATADIGVAVMLFLIGSQFRGRGAGLLVATIFVFNPAVIFLSSIWGQWDSLSMFFALTALWLVLSGRVLWSLPMLTYAALVKPQFAALFPILLLAVFIGRRNEGVLVSRPTKSRKRLVFEVGAGIALSVAIVAILSLPLSVGVPPLGKWSLIERLQVAMDTHQQATMYALNLWAVVEPPVNYALQPDSETWKLSLSYRVWGTVLAGAAYVVVLALYARQRDDRAMLWASAAIMLALFLLPTRVHERYLLPGLTFMVLLTLFAPVFRLLYIGLSITYLVNLYFAFSLFDQTSIVSRAVESRFFFVFVGLLNLTMFIALLLSDLRLRISIPWTDHDIEERRDEGTTPATELTS